MIPYTIFSLIMTVVMVGHVCRHVMVYLTIYLVRTVSTVQNISDIKVIHALSSCNDMTGGTLDNSLSSVNCFEVFMKYRHMFLNAVCISPGARQCYLDIMAMNRNYRVTFVDVISLIISRQEWSTYIVIASSQEALADISSSLVPSSYLLIALDDKDWVDDSLFHIYTLFKEEDLNFIVACSSTCINGLLHQAYLFESDLKKHSRWLVLTDGGNAKDIIFDSSPIKISDVVILDILPYRGSVVKRNSSMVSANVYVLDQIQNDTTAVSGGYIDGGNKMVLTKELFRGKKYGLDNSTLIVTLMKWEPFVYKIFENGVISYHGICLDLLAELAQSLNFSYKIVEPEDQQFGRLINGAWTGMVDMIIKQKADIILGPMAMDDARDVVLDFTTPYFVDNSAVILKQDGNTNKWLTLVAPFRYEVYICIFFSFIFSTVLLFVAEEVNPISKAGNRPSDMRERYGDIFWYHFRALMANGGPYVLKSQTGRSIVSCWRLFALLSAVIYSGNLIAFLTDWREEPPFTTLAEMVEQGTYKWGILGGSNYANLFQVSSRSEYRNVWQGVVAGLTEDPDVLSIESDVHLRKVLAGRYAFISDLSLLEIWRQQHCDLQLLQEVFSQVYFAIGLPNNSMHTNAFSNQILKIREAGLVDLWLKRWMPPRSINCETKAGPKRVELLALQSAFYTAGVGVLLALFMLITERFYRRRYTVLRIGKNPGQKCSETPSTQQLNCEISK